MATAVDGVVEDAGRVDAEGGAIGEVASGGAAKTVPVAKATASTTNARGQQDGEDVMEGDKGIAKDGTVRRLLAKHARGGA